MNLVNSSKKPGFNLAQSMLSFTNKKIFNLTRFTVVDIEVNITCSLLHGTWLAATSGEPGSVTKNEPIFSHRLILVTKIHFTSISHEMDVKLIYIHFTPFHTRSWCEISTKYETFFLYKY